jgi:hypothetical protein
VLAFGLGIGVLFLSLYQGNATTATNLPSAASSASPTRSYATS